MAGASGRQALVAGDLYPVESESFFGFGRGRRALGIWRIAGSAVHGSDERPQHIPVLLAPDPQGTTSFARVGVVAFIKVKPVNRDSRGAGLAPLPLPHRRSGAAGQALFYESNQAGTTAGTH